MSEDLKKLFGTNLLKYGLAQMLKGGVIMDVTSAEQAKIAEEAGAVAVMALERVPADIRKEGGVARMAAVQKIREIQEAVSIPVMAKVRIGHYSEADLEESLGVDFIDESEVLTPADDEHHINKWKYKVPFVCGARNLGEALRRISEGAAMIRTKGEAGTGDVKEAVSHMNTIRREIAVLVGYNELEVLVNKYSENEEYKNLAVNSLEKYPLLREISYDSERIVKTIGLLKLNRYYQKKNILGMEDELVRFFRKEKMPVETLEVLLDSMKLGIEEGIMAAITAMYLENVPNAYAEDKQIHQTNKIEIAKRQLESEIENIARDYGVKCELLKRVANICYDPQEFNTLPVVNFAAGGIATPADAMLMRKLGCDGIFVGSGIFKSENPKKTAEAIVIAASQWDNPDYVNEKLEELGNLGGEMPGISHLELTEEKKMQQRGE